MALRPGLRYPVSRFQSHRSGTVRLLSIPIAQAGSGPSSSLACLRFGLRGILSSNRNSSRSGSQPSPPLGNWSVILRSSELRIRPWFRAGTFLSYENGSFRFEATLGLDTVIWHPYQDLPIIRIRSNGHYSHQPCWYRNFLYLEEQRRGLDWAEDLASPGVFEWEISEGPAVWILSSEEAATGEAEAAQRSTCAEDGASPARHRRALPRRRCPIVRRGEGKTIITGYPLVRRSGGETFIALRGLCLRRAD
jgi:hypothetical protein